MSEIAANSVYQTIEDHYRWIFELCVASFPGDLEAAQDCAQESAFQLFHALKNFRQKSSIKTFIFAVVKRVIFRARIRRSKVVQLFMPFEEENEQGVRSRQVQDSFAQLARLEDRSLLLKEIGKLSQNERYAIILHYYLEHDVEEIAEVMGCGVASVKTYLFRGRKKLERSIASSEMLREGLSL